MKWLLIQAAGIHKENEHLRECLSYKRAIESFGWECDIIGQRQPGSMRFNEYDVLFMMEQYESEGLPDISKIKAKHKLQWIVDLHCQTSDFYIKLGQHCNYILHATKNLINDYQAIKNSPQQEQVWLPNAFDNMFLDGQGLIAEKIIDVGFVGSKIPKREQFFDRISKCIPLYRGYHIGKAMIDMVAKMKFHVNYNIGCDINYRTFETIGIGTCLITNYNPILEELGFIHQENCLMYHSESDLIQLFAAYNVENKWKQIAYNGYKLSKQHTYQQRVKDILYILEE